ncbi:MAG: ankyrin repeat domain-containing protein [Lentisphaeraceae bacterium]|nr:ankyrin repeat domain-containing protein [Lentisphaeraceae bacterium]
METTKIIGSFFRDIFAKLDDNARQDLEKIILLGNPTVVEHFIDEHDVTQFLRDSHGNTMLHMFMESLFPKNIQPLIDKGLDVNARNDNGETPLHCGSKGACVGNLEKLIRNGADEFALTLNGDSCLHYAASEGCLSVVSFFLDHCLPVNLMNKQGKTPLDIAIEAEEYEVAALLTQSAAA